MVEDATWVLVFNAHHMTCFGEGREMNGGVVHGLNEYVRASKSGPGQFTTGVRSM